ncbi:vimentin-type intermediate filament-associated coiled-coil protein-like isoform X2 [Myxocyprinus asiaticus]|uniref:vimentin-type intermediate filament-associated coiled-coil protein-like isoform X2 n=1 Tax=Myxocyprinus asiaticus TaxID=70543 RepID=UPI0022220190|nr:vimentin-type intermediate filament-associated coiled-coil protein-like isoform X2 [Myxocyprinus asiaticus]
MSNSEPPRMKSQRPRTSDGKFARNCCPEAEHEDSCFSDRTWNIYFSHAQEISFLHETLCQSEESIHKLNQTLKEKDSLIGQLQHRCQLLDNICKSRPLLDSMLAQMAEAERMGPVSDLGKPTANSSLTDGESNCSPSCLSNHKDFSLSEDDSDDQEIDGVVFGTTV